MRSTPHLALFLGMLTCSQAMGQRQPIYLVDFNGQTAGQPPAVGTPPQPSRTISQINFGDPTVVAQHGALTDQPCQFGNGTTGFDQIQFNLTTPYRFANRPPFLSYEFYEFEADVLVTNLTDRFTMLMDGVGSRSISFHPNGTVTAFGNQGTIQLGTYAIGSVMRLRAEISVHPSSRVARFYIDGNLRGSLSTSLLNLQTPLLRGIRWNLVGADASEAAALDNIRIVGAGGNESQSLGFGTAGGAELSMYFSGTGSLDLHFAPPNSSAAMVISPINNPSPFFGGTLVPDLATAVAPPVTTDADGSFWATVSLVSPFTPLYVQAVYLNPTTLQTEFSNAIEIFL